MYVYTTKRQTYTRIHIHMYISTYIHAYIHTCIYIKMNCIAIVNERRAKEKSTLELYSNSRSKMTINVLVFRRALQVTL